MNDYGLTDLIVDEQRVTPKNKWKGPLTIVALIIIILLVGIFLVKLMLGSPEETITAVDNNKTQQVKGLVQTTDTDNEVKTDELTPIGKETLPMAQEKEKPKTDTPATQKTTDDKKSDDKPKLKIEFNGESKSDKPNTSKTEKETKKPKTDKAETDKTKTDKTKTEKPKTEKPKTEKPKRVTEDKVTPKAEKPKNYDHIPAKERVKKASKPSDLFKKGQSVYYIQVGAFNRDPEAKYLKNITASGFRYVISRDEDTRRVRIGPFKTKDEAAQALVGVHDKVAKDAFIIKRKI